MSSSTHCEVVFPKMAQVYSPLLLHTKHYEQKPHISDTLKAICIWSTFYNRAQLTCNSQWIDLCSHWLCAFSNSKNSTGVGPIGIVYIHHQDVALLDPGCPLRINCSRITRAPRTGPLIAQHSGGWHSYNSAHQNQGGALLHRSSVGVGINDNWKTRMQSSAWNIQLNMWNCILHVYSWWAHKSKTRYHFSWHHNSCNVYMTHRNISRALQYQAISTTHGS